MNESLASRPRGIGSGGLRTWGMMFMATGIAGCAVVQNGILKLSNLSGTQLLQLMQQDSEVMAIATLALVLQAVYCCATPVFAFLLVEGFTHTSDFVKYLLRVVGLALLSEIPYNLAMEGSLWALDSRNPVFGVAVCLIVLYFYRRYGEKTAGNVAIKVAVTLAALFWMSMLGIAEGAPLLVMTVVLWCLRSKPSLRLFGGCMAAVLCMVFSLFYIVAPMSFIAIHMYNGEKSDENKWINYLAYPVVLVSLWLCGWMIGQ